MADQQPDRTADGRLTRAGMEKAIRAGGSVTYNKVTGKNPDGSLIYGHEHITSIDKLPSEADLASTPEEKAVARAKLEEQRRVAEQQLEQLNAPADKPSAVKRETAPPAK